MKTKYDIEDIVYLPCTVREIRVKKDGTVIYTVDPPGHGAYLYFEESELKGELNNGKTNISSKV